MSATATLARFVSTSSYEQLPEPVVSAAKTVILDGVANLLAGSRQPVAQIISEYVRTMGGAPMSTVIGHNLRTSPPFAAFANGVFLHCLDYEVQGRPSSHGTSSILPPLLALAETNDASGKEILNAFVVGWDVQQRIRTASIHADLRGFHPPGVFGPIAAGAASARLLGLGEQQTRVTLGIAASRTGGLFANNGTMVKATHPGNAGRMGLEAALLARSGFIANEEILEASQGYVAALFSGELDYDVLLGDLGDVFHITNPGFNIKRYPAEIYMQWVINAVVDLRSEHGISAEDVVTLAVETPKMHSHLSRPNPKSGLDGKFSFEYCAAVALAKDMIGIDAFSDETRFSPEVESALQKVSLAMNPELPTAQRDFSVTVTATLVDGRTISHHCRYYRGSIENPMTADEHNVKYMDCASRVLSSSDYLRLREMVQNLEEIESVAELMKLIGQEPAHDVG